MFKRFRTRFIEPSGWPARTGKKRALVENPDGSDLWAHAAILREAGYEVATCSGPSDTDGWPPGPDGEPIRCPLLEGGPGRARRCSLVEGADVVVSTCSLAQSHGILAALSSKGAKVLFEAPEPSFEQYRDVGGDVTLIPQPVTEAGLRAAIAEAERRADGGP